MKLLSLVIASALGAAASGAGLKTNIEYGKAGAESRRLHASVPDGTGPFPAAILLDRTNVEDAVNSTLRESFTINHIVSGLPPFLLIHGTVDKSVPCRHSLNFQAKFRERDWTLPTRPHHTCATFCCSCNKRQKVVMRYFRIADSAPHVNPVSPLGFGASL